MNPYVEFRDGGYFLIGKRVSLNSIVALYWAGASAESIQDDFPSLSHEEVYGAIAFYLGNRKVVDQTIEDNLRVFGAEFPPLEQSNPELFSRLQQARRMLLQTAS